MNLTAAVEIDVRAIPPRNRHPLIFGILAALPAGESLVLTNDHDPKPLFYQLRAEQEGYFSWDYLQSGPELWQVRIGRTKEAPHAPQKACCGAMG